MSVCIPSGEECSEPPAPDASTAGETCGSLVGPDTSACCHSCNVGNRSCQSNGCYGGWWCNTASCHCQSPPTSCGSNPGDTDAITVARTDPPSGTVTETGGTVSRLYFAVIGDTRPALQNDTSNYPTAIITRLYADLESLSPRPQLAVATGDYNYASTSGGEADAQIATYMTARATFSNPSFFTMGNHECTGYTSSNCGAGNQDGTTANYEAFMRRMLGPAGQTVPYRSFVVNAADGSWSAKFVIVAANAWDSNQSSWLTRELDVPTTYTFVFRHEPSSADQAPGTTPSDAIIQAHAYTLLIVGHTHRYRHFFRSREVVIGLGGAPITSGDDFGYLIVAQAPNSDVVVSEYDYMTGEANDTFAVKPDGTPGN